MDTCLAKGFRRIGLVMSEPDDSPNMGDRWLGAYLRFQLRIAPENRVPCCEYPADGDFSGNLLRWWETHRPDVVLATRSEPVMAILEAAKSARAARPMHFQLVNEKPERGIPGVHLDPGIVGSLAVDMLVGMMHRGETGLPSEPHHVLVPGRWVETPLPGATPKPKARRAA